MSDEEKKEDYRVEVIIEGGESIRESLMSINQGVSNMLASLSSEMMRGVLDSIKAIDFTPLLELNRETLAGIAASIQELAPQSFLDSLDYRKTFVYPKMLELSDGLDEVEDAIEVITPEVLDKSLPEMGADEKQIILDGQKAILDELTKIRAEMESLTTQMHALPLSQNEDMTIKRIHKSGRQWYSDKEKLEALKAWDELDKSFSAVSLEEFLLQKFGTNEDGSLRVPKSTFHGWRRSPKIKQRYLDS
jgi:DNA repair exonuclease SbcCD ATPase subunit